MLKVEGASYMSDTKTAGVGLVVVVMVVLGVLEVGLELGLEHCCEDRWLHLCRQGDSALLWRLIFGVRHQILC